MGKTYKAALTPNTNTKHLTWTPDLDPNTGSEHLTPDQFV